MLNPEDASRMSDDNLRNLHAEYDDRGRNNSLIAGASNGLAIMSSVGSAAFIAVEVASSNPWWGITAAFYATGAYVERKVGQNAKSNSITDYTIANVLGTEIMRRQCESESRSNNNFYEL